MTGNFKPTSSILPIPEFSDIPRRTPKKPLTRTEVNEYNLAHCCHSSFRVIFLIGRGQNSAGRSMYVHVNMWLKDNFSFANGN